MNRGGKVLLFILLAVLGLFLISIIYMYTREDPELTRRRNSVMRVEVLNGCGESRLAIKVANRLRRESFNVIRIDNAPGSDYAETVVIERSREDGKNAAYFAKRIGCRNTGRDVDPALHLDVSLILGQDYEKYFPGIEEEF